MDGEFINSAGADASSTKIRRGSKLPRTLKYVPTPIFHNTTILVVEIYIDGRPDEVKLYGYSGKAGEGQSQGLNMPFSLLMRDRERGEFLMKLGCLPS